MELARTRELFSALISRPQFEDRLLMRPPFKFLHDIVTETIRATGFMDGLFTPDELDSSKAAANRDTKVAFLTKLKNRLNDDGELDSVQPSKIVAGKDAELTNLMLQKLAVEAAAANIGRPTKQSRSSSRSTKKPRRSEDPPADEAERRAAKKERDHEIEREKRRLSKASTITPTPAANGGSRVSKSTTKPTAKATAKDSKTKERTSKSKDSVSKSSTKTKVSTSTKEKPKTKDSRSTSRTRQPEPVDIPVESPRQTSASLGARAAHTDTDEGIGSAGPRRSRRHAAEEEEENERQMQMRESSGGTSKGEDSGIAEEPSEAPDSGAASARRAASGTSTRIHSSTSQRATELRDAEIGPTYRQPAANRTESERIDEPSATLEPMAEKPPMMSPHSSPRPPPQIGNRPTTAAGRPQTSVGRPGTAAARPAPPKVKKTKIADLDPQTVSAVPSGFEKSTVIVDSVTEAVPNEFLVDEEENLETMNAVGDGADIRDLMANSSTDKHGVLVNRIIANARTIEQMGAADEESDEFLSGMDPHESRKLRADVDLAQRSLQSVAQSVQPLSRTMEYVAEDLETLFREIEESRKERTQIQQRLSEVRARRNDGTAALTAQLRNADAELQRVRAQIARSTANVIENEKRINALMMSS